MAGKKRAKKEKKTAKQAPPKAPSVEFCKKCGAILVPQKKRTNVVMKCRHCGYELKKNIRNLKIVEEKKKPAGIIVLEKDDTPLPMTVRECPKCENQKAWYWMQQTRAADEPPTQFFRCTRCKHVWREYK